MHHEHVGTGHPGNISLGRFPDRVGPFLPVALGAPDVVVLPASRLAFIAWSPRALVGPARRLGRRLAVVGVVGVPMVAVGASVVTWLWMGANTELG